MISNAKSQKLFYSNDKKYFSAFLLIFLLYEVYWEELRYEINCWIPVKSKCVEIFVCLNNNWFWAKWK